MSTIEDQPPPLSTSRRPAWDIVIEAMQTLKGRDGYGAIHDRVVADMRERDQTGRVRYGVPLTADNGRKHLVDAYQELLDGAVYLVAWLDELGLTPSASAYGAGFSNWYEILSVQEIVWNHLRAIIRLRALIEGGL